MAWKESDGGRPYRGGGRIDGRRTDRNAYGESNGYGGRNGAKSVESHKKGDGYGADARAGNRSERKDGARDKQPYRKERNAPFGSAYGREREGASDRPPFSRDGRRPFERREPEEAYARGTEPTPTVSDEQPYLLIGRNAVREAIKAGRSIDRILVSNEPDGSLREIVGLARDRKLVIREVDRKKLDELCLPFGHGGKTANHQGIAAYAAGVEYCTVEDILEEAKARNEAPFVIVLDGIEDPHNLGSIIRSADCAGAHGVVIPKRRSASVTAATVKASAGASEYVRIARVVNTKSAIETLKKAGVWIAGADMHGQPMQKQNLGGALALVIGSEGDGLSKLVRESCDFLVSIPMRGHIDSLNAGVAAAVLMFEKRRQDEA